MTGMRRSRPVRSSAACRRRRARTEVEPASPRLAAAAVTVANRAPCMAEAPRLPQSRARNTNCCSCAGV